MKNFAVTPPYRRLPQGSLLRSPVRMSMTMVAMLRWVALLEGAGELVPEPLPGVETPAGPGVRSRDHLSLR